MPKLRLADVPSTQAGRIPLSLSKDLKKLAVDLDTTKEFLLASALLELLKKHGRVPSEPDILEQMYGITEE